MTRPSRARFSAPDASYRMPWSAACTTNTFESEFSVHTGVRGRTVTLKIKFADFQIITRSRSRVEPISDRSMLASVSAELLAAQFPMRKGVRLIGVSLSSLCADPADVDMQMTLAL